MSHVAVHELPTVVPESPERDRLPFYRLSAMVPRVFCLPRKQNAQRWEVLVSGLVSPSRVVAELKELAALTGDADGAQRVAFTPTWAVARRWLQEKLAQVPGVEVHQDAAGNLWATIRGASERSLLIGGHIDSVPNGGWLDGCLNLLAGLEVLRRVAAE